MRTLVVGDLHLMESLVLPIVEAKALEYKVNQIVLVGDYFDQWNKDTNSNLYYRELNFLVEWTTSLRSRGVDVICLLGNHDIPYLTGDLRHYSIHDIAVVQEIKNKLIELGVQLAFEVDGYIISHGGFAGVETPKAWYFSNISYMHISELYRLENIVGKARGGFSPFGSLVWADYVHELASSYNKDYPKQIVGHTPLKHVTNNINDNGTIYDVDTFSLYQNYNPIGNGDLLLLEDGEVKVIPTTISEAIRKANEAGDLFSLV
jgi:predicted phosphodiesterase